MCETHTHTCSSRRLLFISWLQLQNMSQGWKGCASVRAVESTRSNLPGFCCSRGQKWQISFLYFYNQCFLLPQDPSTSNLHYIYLFQALMLLLTGKKTPSASKMQIKVPSYNSGFNTKKKHYFSGAFAMDFFSSAPSDFFCSAA